MRLRLPLIIIILFLITTLFNIEIDVGQEMSDEGFADFLFREGEYYRAITEYYRIMYDHKLDSPKHRIAEKYRTLLLYGS